MARSAGGRSATKRGQRRRRGPAWSANPRRVRAVSQRGEAQIAPIVAFTIGLAIPMRRWMRMRGSNQLPMPAPIKSDQEAQCPQSMWPAGFDSTCLLRSSRHSIEAPRNPSMGVEGNRSRSGGFAQARLAKRTGGDCISVSNCSLWPGDCRRYSSHAGSPPPSEPVKAREGPSRHTDGPSFV